MVVPLIILLLAAACNVLGLAVFETVVALFLGTAALAYPLGGFMGLTLGTYALLFALLLANLWAMQRYRNVELSWRWRTEEFVPILVWVGAYVIANQISMLWPDFVSIGERLRDYAILSSVIQHPLEAREPWMAGYTLNYYLFWYRFAHLLSTIGGLEIWDAYRAIQSFTYSLYLACFFRFFSRYLKFGTFAAVASAVLITYGSNLSGIAYYAVQDANWWGPSRVIPGVINEFPAWSFLLGDVHPHFLNLPLLPFCVLFALAVFPSFRALRPIVSIPAAVFAAGVVLVWTFGSNAWEAPFAAFVIACVYAGALLCWKKLPAAVNGRSSPSVIFVGGVLLLAVAAGSIHFASKNITPPGDPFRVVTLPIASEFFSSAIVTFGKILRLNIQPPVEAGAGTMTFELLRHWGLPLLLIGLSFVLLSESKLEGAAKALALALGYLSGSALIFLVFYVILAFWRLFQIRAREGEIDPAALAVECSGVAALFGIMFPEVIFIDDPYGGENERMNTVFKFYSAAWGFLHLYAFSLVALVLAKFPRFSRAKEVRYGGWIVALTLLLGFFVTSIKLRANKDFTILPYSQGLSGINQLYAGAGDAIQKLEKMPRGIVLEAQGGAYNNTSMVSTLSANEAFLGWANHVQLLTKQYDEVGRREKVTRDFYTDSDCEKRAETMKKEGIVYAVLGALERQNYGEIDTGGFSCLKTVIEAQDFRIFALP